MSKTKNKISKLIVIDSSCIEEIKEALIVTDSSRIEEIKEALLSWLKDNKNIKKIEMQQELIETTPPGAIWKEFKPGKRKLIISE